jgi:hypothetical protein
MMKFTLFALTITIICISDVFADIAPNPIKAKGILPGGNTNIRMVSERVIVDLYKDSSVVECHFLMKNEGKKQLINIGFPEMNFHHFKTTNTSDSESRFFVHENKKEVQLIDFYTPYPGLSKKKEIYEKQPWYLWDSEFYEGETKIIKVRYSLPFGVIRNCCRYFTYLLNTGSGWKGSIDTAVIIINLKDITADLILEAKPENYKIEENQIIWKFYNLEPTTNDDIKINYEPSKGYNAKMKLQKPEPTYVLNEQILPDYRFSDSIPTDEILTIKVLKSLEETEKYSSGEDGVVLIYTKGYAIDKLNKLLISKSSDKHSLAYESSSDFLEKYELVIDQTTYEDKELLLKILELKEDEIKNVKIKKEPMRKIYIQIKLKI